LTTPQSISFSLSLIHFNSWTHFLWKSSEQSESITHTVVDLDISSRADQGKGKEKSTSIDGGVTLLRRTSDSRRFGKAGGKEESDASKPLLVDDDSAEDE